MNVLSNVFSKAERCAMLYYVIIESPLTWTLNQVKYVKETHESYTKLFKWRKIALKLCKTTSISFFKAKTKYN